QLSKQRMLELAFPFERHVDNIGASLYGGLIVGNEVAGKVHCISCPKPNLELVAVIPTYELKTSDARAALPEELPFGAAVAAGGRSTLLAAALLSGDYETMGHVMYNDLYHQPYRMPLVRELGACMERYADDRRVYGVTLSGAGPTVLLYVTHEQSKAIVAELQQTYPDYEVVALDIAQEGLVVERYEMKKS
ncbi:MAG: homoserine kinase, partial [Bacilli bacterium]